MTKEFVKFSTFAQATDDFLNISPSSIKFAQMAGGKNAGDYIDLVRAAAISPDTFKETTGLGATAGLSGTSKGEGFYSAPVAGLDNGKSGGRLV